MLYLIPKFSVSTHKLSSIRVLAAFPLKDCSPVINGVTTGHVNIMINSQASYHSAHTNTTSHYRVYVNVD